MLRFATCLALLAACHHAQPAGPASGSGVISKKVALSWGISPSGDGADLFLAQTDETGHQVSTAIGHYPGPCTPVTPAAAMKALLAVDCKGVEIQAVVRGAEAILLKLPIGGDPMSREELQHVKLPPDASIGI